MQRNHVASAVIGSPLAHASCSNRIYVEAGGSTALAAIKAALPLAPLDLVDAAGQIWLLRANLIAGPRSRCSARSPPAIPEGR